VGQSGEPTLAEAEWGRITPGTAVHKISGLFPRVDPASATTAPATAAPTAGGAGPARVSIDDFAKLDLRVAEVMAATTLPKSKKLLKLTLSLGTEERTVVAGIAEHYVPADLVGKKVVIVANLEPAKLMGVESNGMVLAGSADGTLAVLTLERDLPAGARVK
jgi:methionyl-tRNA synthetase